MVKVLIVEDSPVVQAFLQNILETDPEIQVTALARDGREAVAAVKRYRPDVVTMDINLPHLNGFAATRAIMEETPTPVIIVSGEWDTKRVETIFQAMDAGALMCLPRPAGRGEEGHEAAARALIDNVKSMAEVKVVRRWPRKTHLAPGVEKEKVSLAPATTTRPDDIQVVAIGASVGGPLALKTILAALPPWLPWPVLVVQHIASGFTQGLVDWLAQATALPVRIARQGEKILPSQVYVAPDNSQMQVKTGGIITLTEEFSADGHRPSVAVLFGSVAAVYGRRSLGILLTGMGRDGAAELKLMKDKGAITLAQDQETAVVFGMPGEAVRLGAADYVLPLEKIAPFIADLAKDKPGKR
jgi:two-component system chemotaxis response regulator CheB